MMALLLLELLLTGDVEASRAMVHVMRPMHRGRGSQAGLSDLVDDHLEVVNDLLEEGNHDAVVASTVFYESTRKLVIAIENPRKLHQGIQTLCLSLGKKVLVRVLPLLLWVLPLLLRVLMARNPVGEHHLLLFGAAVASQLARDVVEEGSG